MELADQTLDLMPEDGIDYLCPLCHQSNWVEKATSVIRRNSGSVIVGHSTHPYVSTLASMLSLPPRPGAPSGQKLFAWVMVCWSAAALIALLLTLSQQQSVVKIPSDVTDTAILVAVAVLGLAVPLALGIYWGVRNLLARRRLPQWLAANSVWSSLFYCSADDVIFTQGREDFTAPENMFAFLSQLSEGPA